MLDGAAPGEQLGSAVSSQGDIDGDGYCDVAIGSSGATVAALTRAGIVRLWNGSASGIGAASTRAIDGTAPNGELGRSIAKLGYRAAHHAADTARCAR